MWPCDWCKVSVGFVSLHWPSFLIVTFNKLCGKTDKTTQRATAMAWLKAFFWTSILKDFSQRQFRAKGNFVVGTITTFTMIKSYFFHFGYLFLSRKSAVLGLSVIWYKILCDNRGTYQWGFYNLENQEVYQREEILKTSEAQGYQYQPVYKLLNRRIISHQRINRFQHSWQIYRSERKMNIIFSSEANSMPLESAFSTFTNWIKIGVKKAKRLLNVNDYR